LNDKERLARFILCQGHGTSLRFPLPRTAGRRSPGVRGLSAVGVGLLPEIRF